MKINHIELSAKKKAVIMKSTLWNTLITVFKQERDINIELFIGAISIKNNIFFVSYTKPILKAETEFFQEEIQKTFAQKLEKMWISSEEIIIKYK